MDERCCSLRARRHELVYVGSVEWGVTRATVAAVIDRCPTRATPPCSGGDRQQGIVWLEPRAVVEVSYSEVMQGRLRDPVLRGLIFNR